MLNRLHWHIGMERTFCILNYRQIQKKKYFRFFHPFNEKAGGALASLLSGILIHYTGRWDVVFYFLTCLLAVWWALFATLCFEQPRNHPFISNSEREYLQRKIEDYENERKQLPPLPWRAMIKCSPVWALALSTVRIDHCLCSDYIVLTYIFPFIVIGSIQLVILYHQQRFTEVSQRYSPRVN